MPYISDIFVREVVGEEGNKAIEATVETESGVSTSAIYSNVSLNVKQVLALLNEKVAPKLIGYDVREQRLIDNKLADVKSFSTLVISVACQKASCEYQKKHPYDNLGGCLNDTLPKVWFKVGEGGLFASLSISFNKELTILEQYHYYLDIYKSFKKACKDDENNLTEKSLTTLIDCINKSGLKLGTDVNLNGTIKGEYITDNKTYSLYGYNKTQNRQAFRQLVTNLMKNYHFSSLEQKISNLNHEELKSLSDVITSYELVSNDVSTLKEYADLFKEIKGIKKVEYNVNNFKINNQVMIDLLVSMKVDIVEVNPFDNYGIKLINEFIRIEEKFNESLEYGE